jgi:spermidine synthase
MTSLRILYGSTIFLSAFLLFLVEPMAAKELLPALGGSSSVWITCLVFFQVALLLGYLYAHWLSRIGSVAKQRGIHLAVLLAGAVVVGVALRFRLDLNHGSNHPVTTIFTALTLSIGLPFLMLGSTSPLLQMWMARSGDGRVPYSLFALSNAGSLLALILYPTLIEPTLTLVHQRMAWSLGFVLYACLSIIISQGQKQSRTTAATQIVESETELPRAPLRTRMLWLLLPMGSAIQLSAVTSHLTSNIAAIPLLWILPLAVYLLTFILAFEFPGGYRRGIVVRFLVLMLAGLGYALTKTDATLPVAVGILFFLIEAFFACWFCHAELYALRPQRPAEATSFYLMIATGGVAGSFFVAIASPLLFVANYDLAIAFFVTAALALAVTWNDGWAQRLLWSTGSILLFALIFMLHIVYARETLLELRNFYGALRVKQSDTPPELHPVRVLLNGTIEHGTQLFAPGMSKIPTTYYAEESGIGIAMRECCGPSPRRIGIVGLGAGTLAAYGRPADEFRFYEINPLVRPIAQNLFTYTRNSGAQITFADGDARASLAHEAPHGYQILVVDAFSGDAIPLHLLTAEAMQVYRRQLAPGGVLAFHVSNQYLNLAPEVALLAAASKMQSWKIDSFTNESRGAYQATWVLVTENRAFLDSPAVQSKGVIVAPVTGLRLWTDDYSSLLPILGWLHQ